MYTCTNDNWKKFPDFLTYYKHSTFDFFCIIKAVLHTMICQADSIGVQITTISILNFDWHGGSLRVLPDLKKICCN